MQGMDHTLPQQHLARGMLLPRFDYEAPETIEQACNLLAGAPAGEARVLAGGTDLLVKMKRGELRPRLVVSLRRVHGHDRMVASVDRGLSLGPLCTMSRLERSPLLTRSWAAIADGAAVVGGPLIRNRATIGGNVINARPCADTVSPLIALGAELELTSAARGMRQLPIDGFIKGPGQPDLAPGEILTGIHLPLAARGTSLGSAYRTVRRRAAMEVTVAGVAAAVVLDAEGQIVLARVVLTSVAPVLLRVAPVEELLAGRAPTPELLAEAGRVARAEAHPIDDHRAPGEYRREAVEVLTRRALAAAVERAGEGGEA